MVICGLPAAAGVGFRPEHFADIVAAPRPIPLVEIHAENYMGAGGTPHRMLRTLRERHALSIHGVGLSLGSAGTLDDTHLGRLAALCDRYQPAVVSEHLAWCRDGGTFLADLLPLPYDEATLHRVGDHVDRMQTVLRRMVLIENPSTYVGLRDSAIPEPEFLAALAARTGCGLLLDVNNLHVSAVNHGFDAAARLSAFPLERVGEIHLAGHARVADPAGGTVLVDDHGSAVDEAVWALFRDVVARTGPVPTVVEWDNEVPSWAVLEAEATAAQAILDRVARRRAA
ncbi:MAG: DUF692 domain-containing protein [Alphaproteobacteria bacterium]|nr:DUF692 domain-containing protein [Alphaproteobacteria bacterium]